MSPPENVPRAHRLLALDGGGIRGVLSLEILRKIEGDLRTLTGDPELVLGDWFDYIGGTSTGAIIAAGLSLGMEVDQILALYTEHGDDMFQRSRLRDRLRFRYDDDQLSEMLRRTFGADTTLGSDDLRTLLLVVLRNTTTDSAWPLSNNPAARYNDRSLPDCNLDLPLWQIVRASTAAPIYFPPETVTLGAGADATEFVFVDGGITPYNNPALQLFLMATLPEYAVGWPTGEQQLLLVSVGTGATPHHDATLEADDLGLIRTIKGALGGLLMGASEQQDLLCRVLGRCIHGPIVDSEIGALDGAGGLLDERLFSYVRYDRTLSAANLADLGLGMIDPSRVTALDGVDAIPDLQRIGKVLAEVIVDPAHFAPFVEAQGSRAR